jgi:FG-GAP-like repeat
MAMASQPYLAATSGPSRSARLARLATLLTLVALLGCPKVSVGAIVFGPRTDYPAGFRPSALAVGDVNGDNRADVVVTNQFTNSFSVFLGDGAGSLGPATTFNTGVEPVSVAVGDLNQDGRVDVVTSNHDGNTVSISYGQGDGSFLPHEALPVGTHPFSVVLADLNNDDLLDIAVSCASAPSVSVILSLGGGTFLPRTNYLTEWAPYSVVASDFNGDGHLDLAAGCAGGSTPGSTVSILLGSGNGTFGPKVDWTIPPVGEVCIVAGDVDNDGHRDLVTGVKSFVSVLRGRGDGTFGPRSDIYVGDYVTNFALADLDRDGSLDLAVCIANHNLVSILRGNGDGSFIFDQDLQTATTPVAVAIGSFDAFIALDVAIANYGSTDVSLIRNFTGMIPTAVSDVVTAIGGISVSVSPNPMNPTGKLTFSTARTGPAKASLFDISGRLIRTLVDESALPAGRHDVHIDGLSAGGEKLASGVYFYSVDAEGGAATGKVMIAR